MKGHIRVLDEKDRIIISRRFISKSMLKNIMDQFRVNFWGKLESGEFTLSILMDAEDEMKAKVREYLEHKKKLKLKLKDANKNGI